MLDRYFFLSINLIDDSLQAQAQSITTLAGLSPLLPDNA